MKSLGKKRKFLLLKQCVLFDILITIFNCTLQEQKEEEVLFLEPCGSPRKIMCLVMMEQVDLTLKPPDQIGYNKSICNNSPYCQPYNSLNVSSENLVLDQLIISKLIFSFILVTCLGDIVWIL